MWDIESKNQSVDRRPRAKRWSDRDHKSVSVAATASLHEPFSRQLVGLTANNGLRSLSVTTGVYKEFKHLAASMGSIAMSVPVEAHWSIGAVQRSHAVPRRAYLILRQELTHVSSEDTLQMAVKAVNDMAGPDGLVPRLLVFGVYLKITQCDSPAPPVQKRAAATRKAMIEVQKAHAGLQINDALNTP
jgi:hypothetical protein